MEVLQQFTTSLTSPTAPVVHTMQYDVVRQIRMRIYSGATVWPVPEGVTAGISYTLPDRTNGYFEQLTDGTAACTIEGNEVTAVVAPILTSVAGTVKAAIVLRQGDKQLSTFPFQIRVTARPGAVTKPEAQPDAVSAYAEKLFYGAESGVAVPLSIGDGLEVRDGALRALNMTPPVLPGVEILEPEKYYEFGAVSSLALTLAEKNDGKAHEYWFQFEPEEGFAGLTISPEVKWVNDPQYPVGKTCVVGIWMGMAVMANV